MHKFKKLNFSHNHFIHKSGYVFKTMNGKDIIIETIIKDNNYPIVIIGGKNYNLVYLLIEYFNLPFKPTDSFTYKINSLNRVEITSIKIKKASFGVSITDDMETKMLAYKCLQKERSANARCTEKITAIQIYGILEIFKFRCVYCLQDLNGRTWHLDHFTAISKQGRNTVENIVPSCPTCNMMKGSMDGYQFIKWCRKITEHNVIKETNHSVYNKKKGIPLT